MIVILLFLFYSVQMDEFTFPHAGQWQLTLAPKSLIPCILSFIGRLAIDNPAVLVLDGGNQFNVLEIADAVNGDEEILEKIQGSRAFTCYQMESLLEATATTNTIIFLLDFLSTFYDESAPFDDRKRLFKNCLTHIRRLSRTNGLLVIAHPPAISSPKTASLIKELENAAYEIFPPEFLLMALESMGDPDMGKTVPTFAQVFDKLQNSFSKFRRALRQSDRLIVDTLFARARKHLSAGGLAARPLPFETILFCMLIEQHKEIMELQELLKGVKTNLK